MNKITHTILAGLAVCSLGLASWAKPQLPVDISCAKSGAGRATISVEFQAPSSDTVITVLGTGSLKMDKVVHHSGRISAHQVVSIPLNFAAGPQAGGLVVEVRGEFAGGVGSEVQTFDIVADKAGSSDVKAKTSGGQAAPKLILVPVQTNTERR